MCLLKCVPSESYHIDIIKGGAKDGEAIRKVNIIGHLNPDMNSICAAISYAYLKNQIDNPIYELVAGSLNQRLRLSSLWLRRAQLITTVTHSD